jgi:hypothetical protein
VDYCAGKPDPDYCEPQQRKLQTAPIVRIFGVTDSGMRLIVCLCTPREVAYVGQQESAFHSSSISLALQTGRLPLSEGENVVDKGVACFCAGNSVCAFVHGFEPYFYAKCVNSRQSPSPDDLPAVMETLNVRLLYLCQLLTAPSACMYVHTNDGIQGLQRYQALFCVSKLGPTGPSSSQHRAGLLRQLG